MSTPPAQPATSKCRGSEAVTHGFRVRVVPAYLGQESREGEEWRAVRHVFAYRISITNEGPRRARLLSRYWLIVDGDGESHEVRGEGVVGEQPDLGPGESHEYESYCPLETSWGTMEGRYTMEADDGALFDIEIARFFLVATDA